MGGGGYMTLVIHNVLECGATLEPSFYVASKHNMP